MRAIVDAYLASVVGERRQLGELGAGGTGIGASELPSGLTNSSAEPAGRRNAV